MFLLLTLFVVSQSFAQPAKIDSLENLLKLHENEDTVKVNLLNKISFEVGEKDVEKARSFATLSKELSEKLNFSKGTIESIWLMGMSYLKSDKPKALTYFQEALKIAEDNDYKPGVLKCLNSLGSVYKKLGQDSIAIASCQKAISIAEESNNQIELAKCRVTLANIYYQLGKNDLAIDGYIKAANSFEEQGELKPQATILMNLGTLHTTMGNHPKSLEYLQKGLKINESIHDKAGTFMCLNGIAGIYSSLDNFEKSLEYYEKALKLAEELNDKAKITVCLNNIGGNYLRTNNPQALEYFQKALVNSEELKEPVLIKGALEKIGNVYENQGDFVKAMDYYQKALKVSEGNVMKGSRCLTLYYAGRTCLKQKKYAVALSYSLKSLDIASELKLVMNQKNLYEQLSDIYAATNDYKKAYTYQKRFQSLNDSAYNESNIKKITALEYTYKFEKEKLALEQEQHKKDVIQAAELKQQRIVILSLIGGFILMFLLVIYIYRSYRIKKKTNILLAHQKHEIEAKNEELVQLNEEISAQKEEISAISNEVELQNTKLQELNATKDKFFGIIAHDLKNPFNAILGFSDLLVASAHDYNQEKTLKYVGLMQSSAKNAYKLLENLLEWARSQTGAIDYKPTQLALCHLVVETEKLCVNMANEKSITIQHEIPDDLMVYADTNMLSTILRNLITNAIKFTHKGGNITITSQVENNKTVITVHDSGIGMDEMTRNKLFKINEKISIVGTEKETGTGLGLLLCKEFVEKQGGKIWVESELGMGSDFKFTIPFKK